MTQLKSGGKQALEMILSKLQYIDHYCADNPAAVRKLTQQIRDELDEKVKPFLLRADPSLEQRVRELEEWRAGQEQSNVTRFKREG